MVGERWVPLSQYSARRYQPTDDTSQPAAAPQPSASASAAPPPQGTTLTSTPLSPTDRDYVIRTIAGEADHPAGDAAVAAVIRNRLQSGQWGNTGQAVVQSPGQFSAWNKVTGYGGGAGGNDIVNNVDPAAYKRIGATVDDVFSGKTPDPTGGALNFYAPGGMSGGRPPSWWSQVSNPIHIGAQWYGTAPGENARVTGGANAAPPLPAPGAQARPITPTPVQAPGPIDPSIIARGGYSPPIPATPGTTINSTPGSQIAGLGQLAGNLKKALGGADDDKAQGQDQIKPQEMPAAPGARNVSPMLGGSAGIGQGYVSPVYAQKMAALNQPVAWNATPMGQGQMPGAGYGPQNQPVYGTSLMSQLQMLSDPTWMNQMAGG
jgi:spore germination cell wall hydrolase CwlJ-like protein